MTVRNENLEENSPYKAPAIRHMNAAEIEACLLYRDASVLILNKPAGIAVHKGAHGGPDIEAFFPHLQFGLPRVPALAHRLDRETSGCLVLGRHAQALKRLGHCFSSNQSEKTYLALTVGAPKEDACLLDTPILKTGHGSRWRIVLDEKGQEAITNVEVLHRGEVSLLKLTPKTGRTHQLRVHCAGAGYPIVGDPFYGVKEGELSAKHASTMLHAASIKIPYYDKKPAIEATAPLPVHMAALMEKYAIAVN